ncbi:MAG: hypothetical protein HY298_16865 [Verrucomicrobia bacterium]|nr:hypothetical protein [Verrucomicrobiota bacterium]
MKRAGRLYLWTGLCAVLLHASSARADMLDTWTKVNPPPQLNTLYSIINTNGLFLVCGANGAITVSTNGINWTNHHTGVSSTFRGITFGNDTYAVAGYDVNNRTIYTSTNLNKWKHEISSPANYFLAITYAAGLFVTVGDTGRIQTSDVGVDWTNHVSGTTNDLYGVAYGGGSFVVVGANGTIVTSADGLNWTNRASGVTNFLRSVAYGDGVFVAVGHDGTILSSTNGSDWSSSSSGTTNFLFGVGHGSTNFVAVGAAGTILSSTNAVDWSPRNSGVTNNFFSVAYGDGRFVTVGLAGQILYSGTPSPPTLTADNYSTNGFQLTITADIGKPYRLQFSPDLLTWADLLSHTNTQATFQYLDTSATNAPIRFYRVASP